jgi:hypothetical protein
LISSVFGIVDGRMPATRLQAAGGILALVAKGLMVAGAVVSAHDGVV